MSCFVAQTSDLTVWLGSGKRLLDHLWSRSSKGTAVAVTGALLGTEWSGFKQFALPMFTKHALGLLEAGSEKGNVLFTVRILGCLANSRMLGELDNEWKAAIASWINNLLSDFVITDESVRIDLVNLSPSSNWDVRSCYFKKQRLWFLLYRIGASFSPLLPCCRGWRSRQRIPQNNITRRG